MSSTETIDLKQYLGRTSKDWFQFLKPFILDDIVPILKILEQDNKTLPAKTQIFRFAEFPLKNLKFVVLGMDPYPNVGDADGLSFSSRATKCPASLNRIFKVLEAGKLISESPQSWSLDHWALQGALMLNTALSVDVGKPGSHIKLWRPFMEKFLLALDALKPDLIWCLWGNDAQTLEAFIPNGRKLKHCHPVAMVSPSFSQCDHFSKLREKFPEFIWDYRLANQEVHFYTDGACKGNQFANKNKVRAAWGVICTKGIMQSKTWAGKVLTAEVELDGKMVETGPTNIRAEGFALLEALENVKFLRKHGVKSRILSDSKFWIIDMFHEHIPNWLDNQIPFTRKKNSDLTTKLWALYQEVCDSLELEFVNAWHDYPRPVDPVKAERWDGNRLAEEAAEGVLEA
jgi:uracil-DNA glycosylase